MASTADGIPEALAQGRAGLLAPVGDATTLGQHLHDVLTQPDLAAGLRAAALQQSLTFTVERMSDEYVSLYARLIGT